MKLKMVSVLIVGLFLAGCGGPTSANTSIETNKASQVKSEKTDSSATNASIETTQNTSTSVKSSDEKITVKSTQDDKKSATEKLTASIQTWIVDKNSFRTDYNSYSPEITILESGDTLKTLDHLKKLEDDYTSLQADYDLLVKDTSNFGDIIKDNPELKQDSNVMDLVMAIGTAVDDVGTINKIIKSDVDNVIQIANKFNTGQLKNSDVSPPHLDQLKTVTGDFKAQNLKIEQILSKIK